MRYYYFSITVAIFAIILYLIFRSKRVINISRKLPKDGEWKDRSTSGITDITIHHAASSNSATPEDFAVLHIEERGWVGIGYHYVIARDGTIYQTNPVKKWSWHNGFNNKNAIGVCMVGNMQKETPTLEQYESAIWLAKNLKRKYPSIRRLIGHKEYAGETLCPGRFTNINYLRSKTNLKGVNESGFGNLVSIQKRQIYYDPSKADN